MKNKLAFLSMAILLFIALPFQAKAADNQFSDVKTHWAHEEIMYLYNHHIISGYPDGTFKPNEPITRVQAAAMLIKALDIPLTVNTTVQFKDVAKTSQYYAVLATVHEKGILRGDNGFMRPGETTTRAQMAAILRRSFELPLDTQATFIDVSPAHWAYQDINGIAKQRIAGGSNGKYMPAGSVTRAHFSAFLVRALDDNMKLDHYHSYVSSKGKTVEQNGSTYTIVKNDSKFHLTKVTKKTGKKDILLNTLDMKKEDFFQTLMLTGFPLIVYNEDIFIPYWYSVGEMSELPASYGLMKVKTDGQNFEFMNHPSGATFRNMYIWNDRIFYTNEKNKQRYFDYTFDEKTPLDDPLVLISTAMDGSNKKIEFGFDARVIFDDVTFTPKHVKVNQNNKSIVFDHSAMYYFNKKGVFKYSLLDQKTSKLSNILAKDMHVTSTHIEVMDQKGKIHSLKK
ncbi:S-layer homology domain-containing protein [Sporosarcina sp. E16_8]|uniref:S-layer homology domain-containing protein n=1 Tax=Sporosarcina sp. E16_8 TaxID=2789295 RepID=UPI001A9341DB|nr:S-layer homology domain-containing protein [Sporosarcina sp. E16_8]MBO0587210.1 S-layer homology domain-containing protein [Sporosarcina sp. E16_8]